MTYRLRVTLLAAAAVAVAVVAAAALMYVVVRRQLVDQVDTTMQSTAQVAQELAERALRGPGPFFRFSSSVSGNANIPGQLVTASGTIARADYGPVSPIVTNEVKQVASGDRASFTGDVYVTGTDGHTYHVRVYAVPLGSGQALELWQLMDAVDATLDRLRDILIAVAAGGVALAALLGFLVARAVLAPVKRLTGAVEEVARTRDLSQRIGASGKDELARLARSFDGMLAALEMSLRQQRQLVADASHELRTPLTSLRTNLELLARGQPTDPEERQQLLGDLVAQMERLSTLVADLIDLARDEEMPFPVEDLRLDEIASTAVDEVRMRYPAVAFRSELRPVTIRGVRPRVMRAVTNLLDNAAKWSPAGSAVEVSVAGSEIVVRDHGPGISPEDAAHVFDRFWRAPSARQLPGSGLGLSIVKQVAEAHGGSVTLERPNDGGARFRLKLLSAPH
ncbi:MAG: HAMP domain-containing histidine kinase [Chloroflexota bacterium]|nr:HAMP domain-containing histidine kinase [Chloroflexota bacterium]MDE3193049.1 HAMP domain-containing histidine kinase [Chloroflexota bacterium]